MRDRIERASAIRTAFLALLLAAGPAGAGTPPQRLSAAEVSKKVEEAQAGVKDARMDLEMEMKDALSGQVQKVRGSILMKSPDRVFVHYTKPTEQFLYVGGALMQMYQPDQGTVYVQRNGGKKDASPIYLGVGRQLKRYIDTSKVTVLKDDHDEVDLLLIPLSEDQGFDRMRVDIHKKDWWPYQMEVETPSMTTKARFSGLKFNQGLKDGVFEFKPPKGAQVVEGAIF